MGGSAHQNGARTRKRLHPGRDVHRVAHRRVLARGLRTDHPDHDGPGVDADADLEVDLELGAEVVDRASHVEPAAHRAERIVLMRDRRAEEREHAVAHQSRDRPVVPRDGRVHARERLAHDLGPILGIHALGDRGRPGDVGEEHCDRPSFAGPGRLW